MHILSSIWHLWNTTTVETRAHHVSRGHCWHEFALFTWHSLEIIVAAGPVTLCARNNTQFGIWVCWLSISTEDRTVSILWLVCLVAAVVLFISVNKCLIKRIWRQQQPKSRKFCICTVANHSDIPVTDAPSSELNLFSHTHPGSSLRGKLKAVSVILRDNLSIMRFH